MSTKPRQPDLVIAPAIERLIGRVHCYPDSLDDEAEFKAIVQAWRPALGD